MIGEGDSPILQEGGGEPGGEKPPFPLQTSLAFKNQIHELVLERDDLRLKLRRLEEEGRGGTPLAGLGRTSDLAANRIVELHKKVSELQQRVANNADASEKDKEIAELKEKLRIANCQLTESRNQCQLLRSELRIAQSKVSPAGKGGSQDRARSQQRTPESAERHSPGLHRDTSLQTEHRVRALSTELSAARNKAEQLSARLHRAEQDNNRLTSQMVGDKSKDMAVNRLEQQMTNLKKELAQEKIKNEQLVGVVSEKEARIGNLQSKLSSSSSSCTTCDSCESRSAPKPPTTYPDIHHGGCDVEKSILMELVGAGGRRLEEERQRCFKAEEALRLERRRAARLETKMSRLELERVGRSGLYKKPGQSQERQQLEWEQLTDKAELLEEKCLALEGRLKRLEQEKEEDTRKYLQLVAENRPRTRTTS